MSLSVRLYSKAGKKGGRRGAGAEAQHSGECQRQGSPWSLARCAIPGRRRDAPVSPASAMYRGEEDETVCLPERQMGPSDASSSPLACVLQEPSVVAPDGSNRTHIVDLLRQSRARWLKNTEVCDILLNYRAYDFSLSNNAPVCPPGAPRRNAPKSASTFSRGSCFLDARVFRQE